ncbi:MAG: polysaccharide pyruvyl transferase family protein [Rikenellaceae bacterium]
MKKIGILTFHCANNYGAVLQGYALQTYIASLGHEVEIIDYRPDYLLNLYRSFYKFEADPTSNTPTPLRFLNWIVLTLRYTCKRVKYNRSFDKFNAQYIKLSKECDETNIYCNTNYDVYVVGSDQVWNYGLTRGLDNLFWGNFEIGEGAKRITYAASSSKYSFDDKQRGSVASFLPLFDKISVRESELQDCLKSEFNVDSQLVCDPTLLVDSGVWHEMAVKPKSTGYVLVYFTTPETLALATKIAKAKGLKVVSIYQIYDIFSNVGEAYSPAEFVGAFKYADYVVCHSFHGLVFSLLFNREFCVFGSGKSSDSRMLSLLEKTNIEGRYITNVDDMDMSIFDSKIDYSVVNAKIDEFRSTSRDFLKESI